jgi:hypothetical protein
MKVIQDVLCTRRAQVILCHIYVFHIYVTQKNVIEKKRMGYKNSLWTATVRRTLQKYVFNLDRNLSSGN